MPTIVPEQQRYEKPFRRIILVVLDGVGCGALPDAAAYGDDDANTIAHVAAAVGGLKVPVLQRLGLGNIIPITGVAPAAHPDAMWGKMAERSIGKDSTTGHWEMVGAVQRVPFTTYPHGFPREIIAAFTRISAKAPLGNIAASGTEIIARLGDEHLRSGRLIVYTSADSVFQIAAHEQVMPPERLYRLCEQMRTVLDDYGVARVIARPFVGDAVAGFTRTAARRDFSMPPPPNVLDALQQRGIAVTGVGKIGDIFCYRGLERCFPTKNNADGMRCLTALLDEVASGLIFVNLIDYDMLYGHRRDAVGFARALEEFDRWLGDFLPLLGDDDMIVITADHVCDPTTAGTEHSREYVPLLAWSPRLATGAALGTRDSFAAVGVTIAENFGVELAVKTTGFNMAG